MSAFQVGCTKSVELLIAAQADPHLISRDQKTALSLATKQAHSEVVSLLLSAKARVGDVDQEGRNCLGVALAGLRSSIVSATGTHVLLPSLGLGEKRGGGEGGGEEDKGEKGLEVDLVTAAGAEIRRWNDTLDAYRESYLHELNKKFEESDGIDCYFVIEVTSDNAPKDRIVGGVVRGCQPDGWGAPPQHYEVVRADLQDALITFSIYMWNHIGSDSRLGSMELSVRSLVHQGSYLHQWFDIEKRGAGELNKGTGLRVPLLTGNIYLKLQMVGAQQVFTIAPKL